jgi:hypothetical protein
MTEIPTWWLVVSAIFFVVNILFFVALGVAVFKMVQVVQGITPKVAAISARVDQIGHKVEELTTSVKETADTLGGRAKSVAGSVDLIAHSASRQFEKYSPVIVGVLTTLKLLKAVQEYRRGHDVAEATTQAATEPKETVEEQRKVDRKLRKRENK